MFVKLISETMIEKAPRCIHVGAETFVLPTPEQYAEGGYYELVEVTKPEPRKWYTVVAKYATVGNKVQQSYEYEKVERPEYSDLIVGYIRERYSINDELALQRQWDNSTEKKREFNEYNDFCEECKVKAKADLAEYDEA